MKNSCVSLLLIMCFLSTTNLPAFEREQDVPRLVQNERQLMLHFLQGKGFFKESNYEQARQEFLKVVNLNAEYRPAFEYLERIQDIEIQKAQKEQQRLAYMKKALDDADRVQQKQHLPSDEDLFYQLTQDEQKKLDGYVGDRDFQSMIEDQRLTVLNKAKQIKKDIDQVLAERRKEDVMNSVAGREEPFEVQGFEPYTREDATMEGNVERVAEAQEEVDAQFFFNRRQKIESYYERGVESYKLKDYPQAKGFFEKVLKLEPGYKYAQDYFESCKSQLILLEIQNRRDRDILKQSRENHKPRLQEPIEIVSENKALHESSAIAEQMSQSFEERKGALLTGHRDELLAAGIEAMEMKDFNKALEIFEQILRYDPKDRNAQKYRQKVLAEVSAKEEAVLEAMSQVKDISFETTPPTPVVNPMEQQFVKDEAYANMGIAEKQNRVVELYETGKHYYRQKNYTAALQHFRELQLLEPAHRYVEKYIHRCMELLGLQQQQQAQIHLDPEEIYKQGMAAYKKKHYRVAARHFWDVLKLNPDHRKAQQMLKKSLAPLDMDIQTLLAEVEAKEVIKTDDAPIEPAEQPLLPKVTGQETPEVLYEKAKALYRAEQHKEAIPLFEALVPLLPNDPHVDRFLTLSRQKFVAAGGSDEDLAAAAPAVASTESTQQEPVTDVPQTTEQIPSEFDGYYEQGKTYFRQGQYKEAIAQFEKAVELVPNHRYAPRYLQRSKEKLAAERLGAAQAEETASPQDQEFEKYYEEGKRLYREGNYEQAIPLFEQAVQIKPDHRYAPRYLERSQEKLAEQQAESVQVVSVSEEAAAPMAANEDDGASVNTDEQDLEAKFTQLYEDGKTLYREGNYEQAIPLFEQAVQIKPDHRYAPRYLERSQEKLAEQQSAQGDAASEPVTTSPQAAVANNVSTEQDLEAKFTRLYEQGKQLYRDGDYGAAIDIFEQAVAIKPDHRYAPRYLDRSREKLAEQQGSVSQETPAVNESAGSANDTNDSQVDNNVTETSNEEDVEAQFNNFYEQGKDLYRQGNYADAIVQFEQAVALKPDHRYAPRYLDRSREKLEEQASQDTQSALYQEKQTDGVAVGQQDRFPSTEEVLEFNANPNMGVIKLKPSDAKETIEFNAIKNQSVPVVGDKDFEAEEDLMEFERYTPIVYPVVDAEPKVVVSNEQDVQPAPKAISRSSRKSRKYYFKGLNYFKQKRFELAGRQFDKAISYDQGNSLAHRYLVLTAQMLKSEGKEFQSKHLPDQLSKVVDYPVAEEADQKPVMEETQSAPMVEQKPSPAEQPQHETPSWNWRLTSEEAESMIQDAISLFDSGSYYLSEKLFKQVLQSYPQHKVALHYLRFIRVKSASKTPMSRKDYMQAKVIYAKGVIAYKAKNYEKAVIFFEEAAKIAPDNESVIKALRLTRAKLGQVAPKQEVAQESQQATAQQEMSVDDVYEKAKEYYRQKKYRQAYALFQDVLQKQPDHAYAQKYFKRCEEELGQLGLTPDKKEVPFYVFVLQNKVQPDAVATLYDKGKTAYQAKMFEEAAQYFYVAQLIDPKHKNAAKYLARSEKTLDDAMWKKTKDGLDRLFADSDYMAQRQAGATLSKGQKKSMDRLIEKGLRYYRAQDFDKALEMFDRARGIDPFNAELRVWKENAQLLKDIEIHKRRNEIEPMKAKAKKVLETDPDNALAKEYAAFSDMKEQLQDDEKKILMDYEKQLQQIEDEQKKQEVIASLFNEAKTAYDQGRYQAALDGFKAVLQHEENNEYAKMFAKYSYQRVQEQEHVAREMQKVESLQKSLEARQKTAEIAQRTDVVAKKPEPQKAVVVAVTEEVQESPAPKVEAPVVPAAMSDEEKRIVTRNQLMDKGRMLFQQENYDLAVVQFEKAKTLDPDFALADKYIQLIKKKQMIRRKKELEHLNESVYQEEMETMVLREKKIEMLLERGKDLFVQDQYRLAREHFEKILELQPDHVIAKDYLHLTEEKLAKQVMLEEKQMAEIQLKKLREEREERLKQEKVTQEKQQLEELQKEAKQVNSLFEQGKVLYGRGEYQLAIGRFEDILKINPKHRLAFEYLNLSRQGYQTFQKEELDNVHKQKSVVFQKEAEKFSDAQLVYDKALVYYNQQEYERALAYFKRVWTLDKNFRYLSKVQEYIEKISQVKSTQQKAASSESYIEELYETGKAKFVAEQWREALDLFTNVANIDSQYKSVQMYLQVVQDEVDKVQNS